MTISALCPGIIADISGIWEKETRNGQTRFYGRNENICFDGAFKDDFMLLRKGTVAINYYGENGKTKCQLICRANTLINEAKTLTKLHLQTVQYSCWSNVEAVRFSSKMCDRAYLQGRPDLLFNIAYSQAIKLIHAHLMYNALSIYSKLQLVCWFLLCQSRSHGDADSFRPDISQAQMGLLLGINQRTLNRSITFLK